MVKIQRSETADLPPPMVHHCSETVNNKLYVLTGLKSDKKENNTVHVYNMKDKYWEHVEAKGQYPSHRCLATSAVVKDRIYLFGGYQITSQGVHKCFNGMFYFDTKTLEWNHVPATGLSPDPRAGSSMVYYKKNLYVYAGSQGRHMYFGDIYRFDLQKSEWHPIPQRGVYPQRRSCHTANIVDDKMWVFGGIIANDEHKDQKCTNQVYSMDMKTYRWEKVQIKGLVPSARSCHASIELDSYLMIGAGGDLLAGDVYSSDSFDYENDMYVFDTLMKTWSKVSVTGSKSLPRTLGLTCNYDGLHHQLLFFGGKTKTGEPMNDFYGVTFDKKTSNSSIFDGLFGKKKNRIDDLTLEQCFIKQDIKNQLPSPSTPESPGISIDAKKYGMVGSPSPLSPASPGSLPFMDTHEKTFSPSSKKKEYRPMKSSNLLKFTPQTPTSPKQFDITDLTVAQNRNLQAHQQEDDNENQDKDIEDLLGIGDLSLNINNDISMKQGMVRSPSDDSLAKIANRRKPMLGTGNFEHRRQRSNSLPSNQFTNLMASENYPSKSPAGENLLGSKKSKKNQMNSDEFLY